jgi:beta-barrel assembly-enhancing protease
MKFLKILMTGLILLPAAWGQFPGLGGIKGKMDGANSKAKPVTDRAQKAGDMMSEWSPEDEQAIGLASAEKMVTIFGMVDDPALQMYVNLVGQSVAQFASRPLPYRFGVLNTDIIGAFALPGGYVFITKRALAGMKNEAQLAGALGHEVEHASARHLETEIRGKKTSAWAVQESSPYMDRASSRVPGNVNQLRADALIKDLFNTALSRAKEEDADEKGTLMAAWAGYDGAGLMEFLQTLASANDNPANQRYFGQLLSTHPSFQDRIARLNKLKFTRAKGLTLEARFNHALGR